ncbi:unnamed protein product [marine sediment metagenome]|uniref:Uncharacterized protein n=1 Tax=marine sediment metagenome TaxID=412755 RepID=X1QHJ0_9ZZZZ
MWKIYLNCRALSAWGKGASKKSIKQALFFRSSRGNLNHVKIKEE